MTYEEMLEETEIEDIIEGEFQSEHNPPYICYLHSGINNTWADGKVVDSKGVTTIELYREKGDEKSPKSLRDVLKRHRINYFEAIVWIGGDQQVYEHIFTIIDKEENK